MFTKRPLHCGYAGQSVLARVSSRPVPFATKFLEHKRPLVCPQTAAKSPRQQAEQSKTTEGDQRSPTQALQARSPNVEVIAADLAAAASALVRASTYLQAVQELEINKNVNDVTGFDSSYQQPKTTTQANVEVPKSVKTALEKLNADQKLEINVIVNTIAGFKCSYLKKSKSKGADLKKFSEAVEASISRLQKSDAVAILKELHDQQKFHVIDSLTVVEKGSTRQYWERRSKLDKLKVDQARAVLQHWWRNCHLKRTTTGAFDYKTIHDVLYNVSPELTKVIARTAWFNAPEENLVAAAAYLITSNDHACASPKNYLPYTNPKLQELIKKLAELAKVTATMPKSSARRNQLLGEVATLIEQWAAQTPVTSRR